MQTYHLNFPGTYKYTLNPLVTTLSMCSDVSFLPLARLPWPGLNVYEPHVKCVVVGLSKAEF